MYTKEVASVLSVWAKSNEGQRDDNNDCESVKSHQRVFAWPRVYVYAPLGGFLVVSV